VARISNAMAYLNAALGPFGVSLTWAAAGAVPDVTIHFAGTTPEGGAADGVLGFTTADNAVYLVEGWSFYTGADPTQVGAGQYDFQTLAEHELAHTVGLGESIDPNSVMYEYLAPGTARRSFTAGNLTLINTDADRYMKVGGIVRGGGIPAVGRLTHSAPGTNSSRSGLLGDAGRVWAWAPARIDPSPSPPDALLRLGGVPVLDAGGSERLKLAPDRDVLVGGGGDDLLIGGGGRDRQVSGYQSDTIAGQTDGTFLPETATHAPGMATLDAVLQEWRASPAGAVCELPLVLGDRANTAAGDTVAMHDFAVYGDGSADPWDGDGGLGWLQ
jgi:hypothetical protein